jgi:NAD(P)-dependent dehydrogenase (short-subunit alcohol dehydrogenase family)
MGGNEPDDGDRGVVVLTASVAAWEGQIGQILYAASKAGVVGITLVAARDLAARFIRVCTIAPGVFDRPILARFSDEIKDSLASAVPHPARLGQPDEFARLAEHIIDNQMLNGETSGSTAQSECVNGDHFATSPGGVAVGCPMGPRYQQAQTVSVFVP